MKETSSEQRLPARMKYFVCDKTGSHQGEFLNLICIEGGCAHKGLICSICRAESHEKHRVLPLKMFLEELNKQKDSTETSQLGKILQELHNNKTEVLTTLRQTVRKMAEAVRKVQENVMNYYASIQREILSKVKLTEQLSSIIGKLVGSQYESDRTARVDLLRVVDNLKVQTAKPKEAEMAIDIDFNSYLSETTAVNVRLNTEVEKLRLSITDFAGVSESACRSTLIKKSGSLQFFSKQNKALEIEVTPNQLEANKTTHNLPRILACQNPLKNGLNRITIRVKNLSNTLALGIGILSKIKERSFGFDGSLLGHGIYVVSNNGTSYSHSEAEQNSTKKNFTFGTNDILEVEYVSRSDRLVFRKQNSQSKTQLRLSIPTTEEGKVYFCALLGGVGDSIELIS